MAMASQESESPRLRVYVLSVFLFGCLIVGGVCLGLSVAGSSIRWLPNAGVALVGIPWVFWVSVYVYSCCKRVEPCEDNKGKATKAMAPAKSCRTRSTDDPIEGHVPDEDDNEDDINRVHETQDDLAKRVESVSLEPQKSLAFS